MTDFRNCGKFIISLDFELLWGTFDKVGGKVNPTYFSNTRKVIPQILRTFESHQVAATWATVGMLFAESEEEWRAYIPKNLPNYHNPNLSPYQWVDRFGLNPLWNFAPELIQIILKTPHQEVGSHTFGHYYVGEPGQHADQWRSDLQAAKRIAFDKFQLRMKSLVFPRNQINLDYLKICQEEGFEQYRSNPTDWYWQETYRETFAKKVFRTADCFVQVGSRKTFDDSKLASSPSAMIQIPASRLLRPYHDQWKWPNRLKLIRIKNEMTYAAKHQEVYHLWWHPHNFGNDPLQSMKELEEILDHFTMLKENFGMESFSMQSLADIHRE
ncbi:polysaccharide deacetylase family protein [Belliella kenyensis]|uniref:Polysaccharide deacetylase family protein n=1 Tax=Belliella kenyensis TaxID=1472724 RepID=A0ABV8EIE9_9BACT|nr:polysaccharide deacetylase family protein [Belliella kenyensis]MCH7401809.1 polysaccharide deacetylase family protein [Belliella kenyensis]MDN3604309.1 polysaccharide deacetylase family protein [Belliella kenyensis]